MWRAMSMEINEKWPENESGAFVAFVGDSVRNVAFHSNISLSLEGFILIWSWKWFKKFHSPLTHAEKICIVTKSLFWHTKKTAVINVRRHARWLDEIHRLFSPQLSETRNTGAGYQIHSKWVLGIFTIFPRAFDAFHTKFDGNSLETVRF